MDHDALPNALDASVPCLAPDAHVSRAVSPPTSSTVPIRISKSTARILRSILTKVNKKPFGKHVRADQIVSKALALLTDEHLNEIKESTYDSKDRLEIEYRKFCQQNGTISKDEFLKIILTAAIPQVNNEAKEPV